MGINLLRKCKDKLLCMAEEDYQIFRKWVKSGEWVKIVEKFNIPENFILHCYYDAAARKIEF